MAEKPKRASEYKSEHVELVRATCLYLATKLGDMMDDLLIIDRHFPSLIGRPSEARQFAGREWQMIRAEERVAANDQGTK